MHNTFLFGRIYTSFEGIRCTINELAIMPKMKKYRTNDNEMKTTTMFSKKKIILTN